MANPISDVASSITSKFDTATIFSAVQWLIVAIVAISAFGGFYWWYRNKKMFNLNITLFEIIGTCYEPTYRDQGKLVKLGSGGFQVLYLRKLKAYRVAYGGRVGRNAYYFFVGRDGYWYNGMLGADVLEIDKLKGYIPVVTTNPTMRAQYTALEKQIEALHGQKQTFWDKYGQWVLNGIYIALIGIFTWLIFREFSTITNGLSGLIDKVTILIDKSNSLLASADVHASGGSANLISVS